MRAPLPAMLVMLYVQTTVITMFLLPQINLKLRPKLLELKPGTHTRAV